MRKWSDEARLEAYASIKRRELDARGHQRRVGKTGARMLDGLLDGYGKSWSRTAMGDEWMWKTYSDWKELGIKRTAVRTQRLNLAGDGLILYEEGIRPTDGQVVNYYCLADPVDLFLKATDERLTLMEASGRRDRFTNRIWKSLLQQRAKVLHWLGRVDGPQPEAHDKRAARDTDPPAQELRFLSESDPLHNYDKKERSFLRETLKKDPHLSLDRSHKLKRARSIEKVSDEDAYSSWETLCSLDAFGDELRELAQIMAEQNEGGRVAYTKVWRKLGQRYLKYRSQRPHLSDDAWLEGFWGAIVHDAPNIKYVVKVAESLHRRANSDRRRVAAEGPPPQERLGSRHEISSRRSADPAVEDDGNGHGRAISTMTRRRETVNRYRSRYDNGDTVQLEDTAELDLEEAGNRERREELRTLTKGLFKKIETDDD
jgi:hypothetical protein